MARTAKLRTTMLCAALCLVASGTSASNFIWITAIGSGPTYGAAETDGKYIADEICTESGG